METIGKYRIIGALGEGGFGHVYKAEDPAIGNIVAIKVLNVQNDESMIRRFRAEAVTSVRLRHKNIVTIFDFEEQNGIPYLVMEYLDGENLQRLVDNRNAVPTITKLNIMSEVAEGLQYAHEHGIIHRDIKPANIMRLSDGSVKIMDFGIARLIQRDTSLTAAGYMVGTPNYMAPEQFMGGEIDLQVDIWAYGVVFYEFLTGSNPFSASTPGVIMYKVTQENPAPVCDQAPELPRSLDPILRRLLAKKKSDRYPNLDDLRVDLGMVIHELGEAEVAGMEAEAESMIAAGRYDEALAMAGRILRFDHRNAKARKWRSELRYVQRESRIKTLIDEADKNTAALDFPSAETRLQEALQIDPENSAARTRLVQLHEVREKKTRTQSLLAKARVEWERQNLSAAFQHASEAAQTDPASEEASEFLNRIRPALEQQKAATRRESGLNRARGQLLVQDYAGAVLTLQELERQYPGDSEIRARIEEAQRKQDAVLASRQRDEQINAIDSELKECRTLMGEGRLEQAETRARALWKRNPDHPGVLQIVRDLGEHFRQRQTVERPAVTRPLESPPETPRRETYLDHRRAVLELMKGHRIEEAVTRLQELAATFPDEPQAENDLRRAIAHRDEVMRKAAIAKEREALQGLATSREFDQALFKTRELLAIFPQEPELVDLLERAREARDRAARKEAYAERRKVFEELVRNRDFDNALIAVERLAAEFPEQAELQEDLRRTRAARDR